ncbi:GH3 domain-containing protein-like [Diadema antillarum]|uniref:GH3 domain-containing protein-like n=1 Tax=Diadema antillarum TaxID=105358 RepID=UPI003A87A3C2
MKVGLGAFFLLLAAGLHFVSRMPSSPNDNILSTLRHIREVTRRYILGRREMALLRKSWQNPRQSQEKFLLDILRENADTVYGREHRLGEIRSMEEFRRRHPLTSYEHYRPYVDRTMRGESGIITPRTLDNYCRTTGTTGQSKYIPHVMKLHLLDALFYRTTKLAFELCPTLGFLQKEFCFYVHPRVTKAENGVDISSFICFSPKDSRRLDLFTSPPDAFGISSIKDASYIHVLFALREPSIGIFYFFFLHYMESMMKILEQRWPDVVSDIERGTIHKDIELDDGVRAALEATLGSGDRERARQLRHEFEKGFKGIMRRIWPDVAIVVGIDNTKIWPMLEAKYAPGIPLLPFVYGSSEAILGQAVWFSKKQRGYYPINTELIYEFIELADTDKDQPKTFLLDELKVGKQYEVVITQLSGLYRYRMGDIIRVVAFDGKTPILEVLYRLGTMLNVRYEKLTEVVVRESVYAAVARWPGLTLCDYAVAESPLIPETSPAFEPDEVMPFYLIFLEVKQENGQGKITLTEEQKSMIDTELRRRNSDYERLRTDDGISHPRIHLVKPDTFDELKTYVLANTGATANQYKTPRKLRLYGMAELLLNHTQD